MDEETLDKCATHCVKITKLCQSILHECNCSLDESMTIVTALIETCICQMIDTGTSLKQAEDIIDLLGKRLYHSLITDEGRAKLPKKKK